MRRVLLCLCLVLLACDKEKPKPDDSKKPESTPVPSGLVFNDFLPTTGNSTGLGVRDSGLEGGLADMAGGGGEPAAGGAGGGDEAAGANEKLKVTERGSEPRAARKYTFTPNKVDKRVFTITQSVTQSAGGQTTPPQETTIKISIDLTPKQVKPAGALIEAKVTKVEIPGAPPQAAQMLASLNGLTGTFEVSSHGDVGEMQFAGSPAMKNQMAQSVLQAISQSVQLLLTPLPTEPIGAGAKWEQTAAPTPEQPERRTMRFTLKEVTNEGGVVDSEIEVKVPRTAAQNPRGGGMMTVEVDGKGKFTQQVRFSQSSPRSEGELTVSQKIEGSDAKGKQTALIIQKSKQLIEAAK
jgi:hypothetical protein